MSKVLKVVAIVAIAVAVVVFAPAIGAALASVAGSLGITVAGSVIASYLVGMAITTALTAALTLFRKPPSMSNSMADRLSTSVNPTAPRKIVFGLTAAGNDVRFFETYGKKKDRYAQAIALASHRINGIRGFYVENDLAWNGGAIVSHADGIESVRAVTEGRSGTGFNLGSGSYWRSTASFTGCAYIAITWKLSSDAWPSGIPSSSRTIVEGCPLYDPRLDSTRGGSGSHRIDDQNTWGWRNGSTEIGRNPALALLTYLIGWKINGKLVWGMGIPAANIDFDSFRTYANLCEEQVATQSGGTVQRYTCDGIFSTADAHDTVINAITAAMGSTKMVDVGGAYTLIGGYDDTAGPKVSLGLDDIVGAAGSSTPFVWVPAPASRERFNIVRGRFADPSNLFQLSDWGDPIEQPALADDIPRTMNLDLGCVSRPETCQRIAKQFLLREYLTPGKFSATFGPNAFAAQVGSIVTLTIPQLGWNAKLFRVEEQAETHDMFYQMTLREESAAIYAWDREEKPLPANIRPTGYDPSDALAPEAFDVTSQSYQGANNYNVSEVHVSWTPEDSGRVTGIQIYSRPVGVDAWTEQAALHDARTGSFIFTSNAPGIDIEVRARFRMASAVYGQWVTKNVSTVAVEVVDNSARDTAGEAKTVADKADNKAGSAIVKADLADGKATQAVDALKDAQGNVVAVRDQIAATKAVIDAAVRQAQSDATKAQTDATKAQNDLATAKVDLSTDIAAAKKAGTDASAEAAQVRADLVPTIATAKKAGDDAAAAAQQVRTDLVPTIDAAKKAGTDAAAQASQISTDLANEVSRAKGAEGTLTTKVETAQRTADGAATSISTETTQRTQGDTALGQRIDSVVAQANTDRGDYTAKINSEATARASGIASVANRTDAIETSAASAAGYLNANPNIMRWSDGNPAPDGWEVWGGSGSMARIPSGQPTGGYAVRTNGEATGDYGFAQMGNNGPVFTTGWYVLEADVELHSGNWLGSGLTIQGQANLDFARDPDAYQAGANNDYIGRRKFSKLVKLEPAGMRNWHAMVNWGLFGTAQKSMTWYRAAVRPATQGEIDGRQAKLDAASADARVAREETARSGADGALGQRIDSVVTQANTDRADYTSKINSEATSRSDAVGAVGRRVDEVVTQANTDRGNLNTRISDEATASSNRDAALGNRTQALESGFAGVSKLVLNENFDNDSTGWDGLPAGLVVPASYGRRNVLRTPPTAKYNAVQGRAIAITSDSQRFKLRASWRCAAATGVYYFGAVFYDGDGNHVGASDGTGNYPLGASVYLDSAIHGWLDREAIIGKGVGGSTYGGTLAIPQGAVWMRPIMFLNYTDVQGSVTEVDYFTIEDVTAVEQANAAIRDEATTRAAQDSALSYRIATTEAQFRGEQDSTIAARIRDEAAASANRDTAIGQRIDSVIAQANTDRGDYLAKINDEATARAGADSANATRSQNLETRMGNAENFSNAINAKVDSHETARVNDNTAFAQRANSLEATRDYQRGQLSSNDLSEEGRKPYGMDAPGSPFISYEGNHGNVGWACHVRDANYIYFHNNHKITKQTGRRIRATCWYYSNTANARARIYWADTAAAGDNNRYRGEGEAPSGFQNGVTGQTGYWNRICSEITITDDWQQNIYAIANCDPANGATQVGGDFYFSGMIIEDVTQVAAANARITDLSTVTSNADAAIANRLQTVESNYVTNAQADAKVSAEATTRSGETGALSNRIGSVETRYSGAGNLVTNSELLSLDGWQITSQPPGTSFDRNGGGADWNIVGENSITIGENGTASSLCEIISAPVSVTGGQYVQGYALGASHRSNNWVSIFFYKNDGTWNGYAGENFSPRFDNGGRDMGGWDQTGVKSWRVPDGTATMRLALRKYPTRDNQYGSIAWFIRPYLGYAREGQTEWNPYSPGSGKASIAAANARISDEATASANRDGAISQRVDTTEAKLRGDQDSGILAAVRDETNTRATQVGGLSSRVGTVETKAKNVATAYTAVSKGNSTVAKFGKGSGIYNVDGGNFTGGGRGFRVSVFDANNTMIASNVYDTLEGLSSGGAGNMASFLNGITEGQAVIITTDDEPQSNRLTGGLVEAMERCGAGPLFSSPKFAFRGAYILVGQAGIGKGNGNEYYSGTGDSAPDAWIEARFDLLGGRPQLNGAGKAVSETNAKLTDEQTARANSDNAISGRVSTTEAKLNGDQDSTLATRIRDEATTRANADAAQSGRISTTEAQLNGSQGSWMAGRINDVDTASANRDSALAQRATTLEAAALVGSSSARNDHFAMWRDGQQHPDNWILWNSEGNYRTERVSGNGGSPYAVRTLNDNANVESGFYQQVPVYAGKWIVEVTAESDGSGFSGAGMTLHGVFNIDFLSDPDTKGYTGDQGNTMRTWNKAFDFDQNFINNIGGTVNFHAMHGWTGFGRYRAPKYMKWHKMSLRPAGYGDAESFRANARITDLATTTANADSALSNRVSTTEANYSGVRNDLNNWNNDRYNQTVAVDARVAREETARADAVSSVANRTSVVEAQVSNDSNNLVRNGTFNAPGWGHGGGIPPYWGGWAQDNGAYIGTTDRTSMYGAPYPLQIDRNGINNGITQRINGPLAPGWYAFEVDVVGEDGNWSGSGIHCNFNNGSVLTYGFATNADTAGRYGDIGNATRRFTVLFKNEAQSDGANIYLMSGWSGFQGGTNFGFVRIIWHRIVMRPATAGEIKAQQVDNLTARVSTTESAVSNLNGRTAAYWQVQSVAGNNRAQMTVRADANGGAGVDIVGDVAITGSNGNGRTVINSSGVYIYYPNGQIAVQLSI
ncbi:hypothetical protein MOP88_14435 [Sphingomonas sp. WKB10]|nr:hypothetical protein [Sphingomonas sp. WKB10]